MCSWKQFHLQDLERENFQISLDYKTVFENSTSPIDILSLFGILIYPLEIRDLFRIYEPFAFLN